MTRRSKLLQIRLSEREHRLLGGWAEDEGLTVSNLVRLELGMDTVKGRGRFPREAVVEAPVVEEVEPPVVMDPERELAERREGRARELSVSMPLAKARALAIREIPE